MIKKLQALRAKKGFTLVELIVVIAIIGVLAAILVPTMMGFVTSSRVTSANSTAASFEDQIETFLTQADTAGYGMLAGQTSLIECEITSTGWDITVDTAASFKSKSGGISWDGSATVAPADTKLSVGDDAEALLGVHLRELFPDLKSGYVCAAVKGGNVEFVIYTADAEDGTNLGDVMPSWSSGVVTATNVNFDTKVCKWDEQTAGISSAGYTVGTAPALALGTP